MEQTQTQTNYLIESVKTWIDSGDKERAFKVLDELDSFCQSLIPAYLNTGERD